MVGHQWIATRQRFEQLNANLQLTHQQREAGLNNASNVVESLNQHYYGRHSRMDNAFLIGSWAGGSSPEYNLIGEAAQLARVQERARMPPSPQKQSLQ